MREQVRPVDQSTPLRQLLVQPRTVKTQAWRAAETAAQAYMAAVRATELFVASLAGTPGSVDLSHYTMLQERENIAWLRRREAFATVGLHHEPQAVDSTW
jgi:hypothetical protein